MTPSRLLDHRDLPLRHERLRVNGVDLHVATGGTGPPLYLVHGCPKTMVSWRYLVPYLTPSHTVTLMDCRGFGESERPATGYDTATMARDVVGVADRLGHDRFTIMGEDWGAAVAYAVAADYRERVARLVFQEMRLPGLPPDPDSVDISTDDTRNAWHFSFFKVPGYPELLMTGREQSFWTQFVRRQAHNVDALREDDLDVLVSSVSRPGGLHAVLSLYRSYDDDARQNEEHLRSKLTQPVLAIGGESYLGDEVRRHMEQAAHNVLGVVIPNSGHHPALENPALLGERLSAFLASQ